MHRGAPVGRSRVVKSWNVKTKQFLMKMVNMFLYFYYVIKCSVFQKRPIVCHH